MRTTNNEIPLDEGGRGEVVSGCPGSCWVSVCVVASLMLGSACDPPTGEVDAVPADDGAVCEAPVVPEEPVTVDDGRFAHAGQEWFPEGVNSYPLLQHVGNGNLAAIRDVFAQAVALGRPVIRTNGFMDGGSNPARIRDADGSIRDAGLVALDVLLDEAARAGVALLLVMTNNWSDYGGASAVVEMVAPGEGLPKDAFWSEPRAVDAQEEYLRILVGRVNGVTGLSYSEDPTIFGWELANEPRCDDPAWCDDATLGDWAAAMSAAIREAGALQPVFWGGEGRDADDLERIAAGGVDVLTLHLYLYYSHPELLGLPREQRVEQAVDIGAEIIADRAATARRLGLPLVVEELGWKLPTQEVSDIERAAIYSGWLEAAAAEGVATFPWMIGEADREDYDGLLIRPTDEQTTEAIACR